MEENQAEEQAALRAGYSTADYLQVITQFVEKTQEFNQVIYLDS